MEQRVQCVSLDLMQSTWLTVSNLDLRLGQAATLTNLVTQIHCAVLFLIIKQYASSMSCIYLNWLFLNNCQGFQLNYLVCYLKDELLWAAAWLYRATNNHYYLQNTVDYAIDLGGTGNAVRIFSWDNKYAGLQILLSKVLLISEQMMSCYVIFLGIDQQADLSRLDIGPTLKGSTWAWKEPTTGPIVA